MKRMSRKEFSAWSLVSNLLDQRVDITTPEVTVVEVEDFSIGNLEPAMGVEIKDTPAGVEWKRI